LLQIIEAAKKEEETGGRQRGYSGDQALTAVIALQKFVVRLSYVPREQKLLLHRDNSSPLTLLLPFLRLTRLWKS